MLRYIGIVWAAVMHFSARDRLNCAIQLATITLQYSHRTVHDCNWSIDAWYLLCSPNSEQRRHALWWQTVNWCAAQTARSKTWPFRLWVRFASDCMICCHHGHEHCIAQCDCSIVVSRIAQNYLAKVHDYPRAMYGTAKKKRPCYLVGNLVATNWPIEKALHAIGYNQIPTK